MQPMTSCWYRKVCTFGMCNSNCIRYLEMNALMEQSNLPKSKQVSKKLTPDDCDYYAFCDLSEIKDNIIDFVDSGKNLYIYSSITGNGKTSWAIKLLLKYFDSIWAGNGFKCRGIFIHTPTFLAKLKDFNNVDPEFESLKLHLTTVDLVVWDDIASTDMSSYDHSQLLSYIDQRILSEKSNIFTGNRNEEEMEKALGSRLASRIWNSSQRIKLKGLDKRK